MTASRSATPPLLKRLNEEAVLAAIRAAAPISRAQLSRRLGISKPTVSLALQTLLEAGLVREAPSRPGRPSYGAVYFEPVAEAAVVIGIDLGARFVRGAICDLSGRTRARRDLELESRGAGAALEAIVALQESLLASVALAEPLVDGIVVGVPGVVEPDGETIGLAENVTGLEGADFARRLREQLAGPVTLENDINLAALGERWQGIARGVDSFAFVSIGTGLGAGIVLRGELLRGHHGAAGELDYVRAGAEAEIDPAGAAVAAIAERVAARGGAPTALAPPFDARAVFAAARGGDPAAREVVAEEGRRIALHVVPIAAVADVELVVLGGGIGANADLLLPTVEPLLQRWLPYPPRVAASMLGDSAVLTGALSVALDAALENVFTRMSRATAATPSSSSTST